MSEETAILIVEDNDFVRMQIATYLKSDGYKVIEAAHGDAAAEKIHADPTIALIVADVRMEPVGGFEFMRGLRAEEIATPAILVTGDQTPDILEQAGKLGVAAVLMKPVEKDRLLGTVRRIVRGQSRG